jgi:hypothetical protein
MKILEILKEWTNRGFEQENLTVFNDYINKVWAKFSRVLEHEGADWDKRLFIRKVDRGHHFCSFWRGLNRFQDLFGLWGNMFFFYI